MFVYAGVLSAMAMVMGKIADENTTFINTSRYLTKFSTIILVRASTHAT
jgi:hypothetical protein